MFRPAATLHGRTPIDIIDDTLKGLRQPLLRSRRRGPHSADHQAIEVFADAHLNEMRGAVRPRG